MEETSRFTPFIADDVLNEGDIIGENLEKAVYIIQSQLDENFIDLKLPEGEYISGRGEKHKDTCGTFSDMYLRVDGKKIHPHLMSCHTQGCRTCFRIWARKQAERSAGYLWGLSERFHREIAHWTLSPDENLIRGLSPKKVWALLDKQLRKIIDTFGSFEESIVAVVRHPARKRCPHCGLHGPKLDHQCVCPVCFEAVEWYWAPHLHVITDFVFNSLEKGKYVHYEHDNQIIFKRIGFPKDKDNLANLLTYEYGHARLQIGVSSPAIRYMGFSAKNHYRSDVKKIKEPVEDEIEMPDGSKAPLGYLKLQFQAWDVVEDGRVHVKKYEGQYPWYKDVFGNHVPEVRTKYEYTIVPLMMPIRIPKRNSKGEISRCKVRWLRIIPPRQKPTFGFDTHQVWDTIQYENAFVKPGRRLPIKWNIRR